MFIAAHISNEKPSGDVAKTLSNKKYPCESKKIPLITLSFLLIASVLFLLISTRGPQQNFHEISRPAKFTFLFFVAFGGQGADQSREFRWGVFKHNSE
jgi:hypothetical protein